MNPRNRMVALWLGLISGVLLGLLGCASPQEAEGPYVDPNTSLVAPYRAKGDGSGITGWDQRAREIERSLGN